MHSDAVHVAPQKTSMATYQGRHSERITRHSELKPSRLARCGVAKR